MAGGGDPNNAMAGASGMAHAFGYGQNVAPAAGLTSPGQLPQWQQGLMGALTGDKAYGKNAPMVHQMLGGLFKQQPQAPAPQPMMRPMMGAPQMPQLGAPQMPMGQPFAAPQQIPSMAPWMAM